MGDRDAELAAGLERVLAKVGRAGQVVDLRRLSGGASRETFGFALAPAGGGEPQRLILQRLRPGTMSNGPGMQGEAVLLRAAAAQGVPVPTVVADDDGTELGGASVVMDHLDGETIARKLLRDDEWAAAREVLTDQAAAALAAIHAIPLEEAPPLRGGDQLEEMRALLDGLGAPLPAMELGLRWLEEHRPASPRRTVVHGDFRLGNLMIGPEGLAGVLDWELSHLGDPIEDLGWYCVRAWRFGSPLPAGGMGTRERVVGSF
jgi:aminoglycoside phosphotransferase (APT) family kinase protein